jgi:hypothetical protein
VVLSIIRGFLSIAFFLFSFLFFFPTVNSAAQTAPQPVAVQVDGCNGWTSGTNACPMPAMSGRTIDFCASGCVYTNFANAWYAAQCGDTIRGRAGQSFNTEFILTNKGCSGSLTSGTGWIVIKSDSASCPAIGTRVKPSDEAFMPELYTDSPNVPVFKLSGPVGYIRFICLEVTLRQDSGEFTDALIKLDPSGASGPNDLPHHLVFDRLSIHGTRTKELRRGISPSGRHIAIVDSVIYDIHQRSSDAQAINCSTCPGPLLIFDNRLEASGENIMFGGSSTQFTTTPSDIIIRRNYIYKPKTWQQNNPQYAGVPWSIKNLIECKSCQRTAIFDNVLENSWAGGQNGHAIVITPRTAGAPGAVGNDIDVQWNLFLNVGAIASISGYDSEEPAPRPIRAQRIRFRHNLAPNVNNTPASNGGTDGRGACFNIIGKTQYIAIEHNTCLPTYQIVNTGVEQQPYVSWTNNYFGHGKYGIKGANAGVGNSTLALNFPMYTMHHNVLVGVGASGNSSSNYTANRTGGFCSSTVCFPEAFTDLIDKVGCNGSVWASCALNSLSPYKKTASDGTDMGADVSLLLLRLNGVRK